MVLFLLPDGDISITFLQAFDRALELQSHADIQIGNFVSGAGVQLVHSSGPYSRGGMPLHPE
jgi:hypothetical protein